MRTGRPVAKIELSAEVAGILEGYTQRRKTAQALALRARIDKAPPVKAWLARHPRYHLHLTPTSTSWLNRVERWFALLADKQIKRGVHRSVHELKAAITAFIQAPNDNPKPTTNL
jgi:hypothetical protein